MKVKLGKLILRAFLVALIAFSIYAILQYAVGINVVWYNIFALSASLVPGARYMFDEKYRQLVNYKIFYVVYEIVLIIILFNIVWIVFVIIVALLFGAN